MVQVHPEWLPKLHVDSETASVLSEDQEVLKFDRTLSL